MSLKDCNHTQWRRGTGFCLSAEGLQRMTESVRACSDDFGPSFHWSNERKDLGIWRLAHFPVWLKGMLCEVCSVLSWLGWHCRRTSCSLRVVRSQSCRNQCLYLEAYWVYGTSPIFLLTNGRSIGAVSDILVCRGQFQFSALHPD